MKVDMLATRLLLPENRLSKVTIIPSTKGFGGFNLSIPKERLYRLNNISLERSRYYWQVGLQRSLTLVQTILPQGHLTISRGISTIKMYIMKFGMDEELGLFNSDAAEMSGDSFLLENAGSYKSIV